MPGVAQVASPNGGATGVRMRRHGRSLHLVHRRGIGGRAAAHPVMTMACPRHDRARAAPTAGTGRVRRSTGGAGDGATVHSCTLPAAHTAGQATSCRTAPPSHSKALFATPQPSPRIHCTMCGCRSVSRQGRNASFENERFVSRSIERDVASGDPGAAARPRGSYPFPSGGELAPRHLQSDGITKDLSVDCQVALEFIEADPFRAVGFAKRKHAKNAAANRVKHVTNPVVHGRFLQPLQQVRVCAVARLGPNGDASIPDGMLGDPALPPHRGRGRPTRSRDCRVAPPRRNRRTRLLSKRSGERVTAGSRPPSDRSGRLNVRRNCRPVLISDATIC